MPYITRRSMLSTTAAAIPAAVLPVISAAAEPTATGSGATVAGGGDAELLALGREFEALNGRYLAMCKLEAEYTAAFRSAIDAATGIPYADRPCYDDPGFDEYNETLSRISDRHPSHSEDEWDSIQPPLWEVVSKIVAIKPTTLAGLGVVARAATYAQQEWWEDSGEPSGELDDAEQCLRHLVGSVLSVAELPEPMTPANVA